MFRHGGPTLFALIREDLTTQREGIFAQGFWALLFYRIAHRRMASRYRIVRIPWRALNIVLQIVSEMFFGISLPESTAVGRRVRIEHFGGIVIHGCARIGDGCVIRQGVTIGNKGSSDPLGAPILGQNVDVGAGAKILGRIVIGDGAVIGANAVVIRDVPANCMAVGVPAVSRTIREVA